jgi:toxin ParE1/3/4
VPKINLSNEADSDAVRIWRDLSSYSDRAAERIVHDIDQAISSLVLFPERGPQRDDLRRGLRMLVVHRYLVIYRFEQSLDEIHILRILEGERDLTDLF